MRVERLPLRYGMLYSMSSIKLIYYIKLKLDVFLLLVCFNAHIRKIQFLLKKA